MGTGTALGTPATWMVSTHGTAPSAADDTVCIVVQVWSDICTRDSHARSSQDASTCSSHVQTTGDDAGALASGALPSRARNTQAPLLTHSNARMSTHYNRMPPSLRSRVLWRGAASQQRRVLHNTVSGACITLSSVLCTLCCTVSPDPGGT